MDKPLNALTSPSLWFSIEFKGQMSNMKLVQLVIITICLKQLKNNTRDSQYKKVNVCREVSEAGSNSSFDILKVDYTLD